jgi:CRISPR/Cas system CSM-associated protein Csm3 (group 7 of RAMP superfamily)
MVKIFEGSLVALSLLHIGTGRPEGGIDNPTIKLPKLVEGKVEEITFIPASTLKGVIRSRFEQIARERGEEICNIFDSECERDEKDPRDMCLACRTFGNQKLASKVRLADVLPISEVRLFEIPGVALGRESSAVVRGPFHVQCIAPGARFKFEMFVDLPDGDRGLEILKGILDEMKNGKIQLGGKKSTGMGWVRLEDLSCR